MTRVTGLGHVGIYVRDLERMVAFHRDVMGMQVTKQKSAGNIQALIGGRGGGQRARQRGVSHAWGDTDCAAPRTL